MADVTHGFVPLHLLDWRDDETVPPNPPLDIDALFFNDTPPHRFLLRGLPGSGKTTPRRYLAHRYASLGATGEKNHLGFAAHRFGARRLSAVSRSRRAEADGDDDRRVFAQMVCR
jgi:hypothetical protein